MQIWKVELKIADMQTIEIPEEAQFLTAQMQHGKITIWFLCDPDMPKVKKDIQIFSTGHDLEDAGKLEYIATVQDGSFVWHVFAARSQQAEDYVVNVNPQPALAKETMQRMLGLLNKTAPKGLRQRRERAREFNWVDGESD